MHKPSRAHGRTAPVGASSPAPRLARTSVLAASIAFSFTIAALVTSVITASPAAAHTKPVRITPASNAQLTKAPTKLVVEFNESVSTKFVTVVVTNAAGISVAKGKPTVVGPKVTQALSPDMVDGDYRVAHRVVGVDGHPITGVSNFTLTLATKSPVTSATTPSSPPATSAPPGPPAAAAAAEVPSAGQSGWLTRFLLPIAGTLGLLIVSAGLILWRHKER